MERKRYVRPIFVFPPGITLAEVVLLHVLFDYLTPKLRGYYEKGERLKLSMEEMKLKIQATQRIWPPSPPQGQRQQSPTIGGYVPTTTTGTINTNL